MKRILTIVFIAIGIPMFAQQLGPNISWDNDKHDFGEILEANGKATYKFEFTNTGNEPLVITNVRPSCGCTSSDYTKEPVMPGVKGYVSATYNPLRRPGKFSKTITITTNSESPTSVLRFTGNVIPKPKSKEEQFPRKMGELRLKSNHLAFATVYNTQKKKDKIEMANTTDHDLDIDFENVPKHISIQAFPKTLKPNEVGYIEVTYDAKLKNDWGFLMDKVMVLVNGDNNNKKNRLSISASISENFANLSAQEKANAPKAVFDSKVFDFAKIEQGQKVSNTFVLTNEGKSELIIRKTKASCGCTILNLDKKIIAPGESANFDITFNSSGKRNKQNKSITIITNDPDNSQISLRLTGFVEVPN